VTSCKSCEDTHRELLNGASLEGGVETLLNLFSGALLIPFSTLCDDEELALNLDKKPKNIKVNRFTVIFMVFQPPIHRDL